MKDSTVVEKKIVLGVTGSIAAYKAADLCSKFTGLGADVNVIMTEASMNLIGPKTFLTLSKNPVITDLWAVSTWRPGHIDLAEKADLFIVAPCTANFIGKLAHGIGDDALSTFALSFTGDIFLAPAMNPKMWHNVAVQANIRLLKERGVVIIEPESGKVACGSDGTGRMRNVREICRIVETFQQTEKMSE
jgi:phosphopantothenoylcysteine synthetase/decarboxylase